MQVAREMLGFESDITNVTDVVEQYGDTAAEVTAGTVDDETVIAAGEAVREAASAVGSSIGGVSRATCHVLGVARRYRLARASSLAQRGQAYATGSTSELIKEEESG